MIAVAVSLVIVALATGFVMRTRRAVLEHMRKDVARMDPTLEETRQLQAMLDSGELTGVGLDVPASLNWRIELADMLSQSWIVLVPLGFVVAILTARLVWP